MKDGWIMRAGCLAPAACLALAACDGPIDGAAHKTSVGLNLPARRAGLWHVTVMQDGRAVAMGSMKPCLDPASDAKLSMLGEHLSSASCKPVVSRLADGKLQIISTCSSGQTGQVAYTAIASGDFSSTYRVHMVSHTTGAALARLNGEHVTDIDGQYLGACPKDMLPGDVLLADGMKLNIDKVRQVARALHAGG